MRRFGLLAIFLSSVILAPYALAADWDDSILSQQILAAVDRYRVIMRDFTQLETATRPAGPASTDPLDDPKVKTYVENSVNPAESEMRRLFDRYRQEHGNKAFEKLASKYEFTDLTR